MEVSLGYREYLRELEGLKAEPLRSRDII